jgi:hypothetical protein
MHDKRIYEDCRMLNHCSPVQCRGERFFIAPVEMKLKVVVSGSELER